MGWNNERDNQLIKEMFVARPWKYENASVQHGSVSKKIWVPIIYLQIRLVKTLFNPISFYCKIKVIITSQKNKVFH